MHSKWQGTYTAYQGETAASITIDGQTATVEIGPTPTNPTLPTGKYTALIEYNTDTKAITLTGAKWINQPTGWMFANFVGFVSDDTISGTVTASGQQVVGKFSFKVKK
ncbi:hypothetical protein D3C71_1754900 [compost metagenome]